MNLIETIRDLAIINGHSVDCTDRSIKCLQCEVWLYWKWLRGEVALHNAILLQCGQEVPVTNFPWTPQLLESLNCHLMQYEAYQVVVNIYDNFLGDIS